MNCRTFSTTTTTTILAREEKANTILLPVLYFLSHTHLIFCELAFKPATSNYQRTSNPTFYSGCLHFFLLLFLSSFFFTSRFSMHERCHVCPWLTEFSGTVLSCFTLSRQTIFTEISPINRKTHSYHCSRQFVIQLTSRNLLSDR